MERENNSFWEIAELIEREMSVLRKNKENTDRVSLSFNTILYKEEKEYEKGTNSQP